MSNSTYDLIASLDSITFWINRIVPPIQILLGMFANIFNMIIFTRRSLRTNPCSLYFLTSSINNIFVICVTLIPRYLATSWNKDPSITNNILCKLRHFFTYASLNLVLWFTVLASIDRYLSSSHNVRLRQLSTLSIARRIVLFTIIFTYVYHSHILIFYKSDVNDNGIICSIFSSGYRIFFNFFASITSSILPIIFMSIFGILMIVNVHYIHNRVGVQTSDARNERLRSNDRQLILMLLLQIFITTLITIPYAVISMYSAVFITVLQYRFSISEQAIYNFVFNLFRVLYYTNSVIGFYIYTLTGPKFRVEMRRCVQYGLRTTMRVTGLIRYLPFRAQEAVRNENQIGANNVFLVRDQKGNIVHPIQQKNQ